MKKFAVIGNPIKHSKSPIIHQYFAEQAGIDIDFIKIETSIDNFENTVSSFFQDGGLGLSVTSPFKIDALCFADVYSNYADWACASNTLSFLNDMIIADNTDGIGFINDIKFNKNFILNDKKILLIGAGGSARGLILPLLEENPKLLHIANRTKEKADELKYLAFNFDKNKNFNSKNNIQSSSIDKINDTYDLIINATSASLHGHSILFKPDWINSHSLVYDLMYSDQLTPFLQHVSQFNVEISDGLGMLVEQAALAFQIWNDFKPDSAMVLNKIRPVSLF